MPQPTQSDAGPDSLNIVGDSIALMGNTAVEGLGLWTILSGTGGSFADSTNPNTSFYGISDSTYVLVWTISNNCGSSLDTVIIGFASQAFFCGDMLNDVRDGQNYSTVQIGTQCWKAENLNIGIRINGSSTQYNNGTIEKYCYNNSTAYCDTYGGLYQWNEMMQFVTTPGAQGICPGGWHIPTDDEWKVLEGNVDSQYGVSDPEWDQTGDRGFDAGLNLKSNTSCNYGGNGVDLYGFICLPSGFRSYDGYFVNIYNSTYIWTSTDYNTSTCRSRNLIYNNAGIYRSGNSKSFGNSVRCLKN
ncbi:MAG: hypothetical protein K8S00_00300 [Bacteroidales bacterium]|nr:hypothetical protein [Bacteroidales bacterium]